MPFARTNHKQKSTDSCLFHCRPVADTFSAIVSGGKSFVSKSQNHFGNHLPRMIRGCFFFFYKIKIYIENHFVIFIATGEIIRHPRSIRFCRGFCTRRTDIVKAHKSFCHATISVNSNCRFKTFRLISFNSLD